MEREHRAQIEIENRVAVGHYERIATEEIAQAVERPAGAEQYRLGRIRDAKSELRAVAESVLNHRRKVMKVDRDVGDTGASEHRERIVDQRMAAEFEHRLWRNVGQRPKPLTHPGCEYQCSHGISAADSLGKSGRISESIRRACSITWGMKRTIAGLAVALEHFETSDHFERVL